MDLFNLPKQENVFLYTNGIEGLAAATKQVTWTKPPTARFVYIMMQGAGGGGGPGASGSAGTQRGGGGGGGSGAIISGLFPAHLLPDSLVFDLGAGGVGASGLNNGTGGGDVWMSLPTRYGASDEYITYAQGGDGGNRGTGSGGGSGGSGGGTTNFTGWMFLGNMQRRVGTSGAGGGSTTTGNNASWGSALLGSGAGGAGCVTGNAGGGDCLGNDEIYRPVPQINNNAVGATTGNPGFLQYQPFTGSGGSGGSSQNAGAGAPGGHSSPIGSGGGGGGAGTSGGKGGNGGGSFVLIITII